MEYRTLELTLSFATELKKGKFFGKNDVYAVAKVFGDGVELQKYKTTKDRNGAWNFPMNFTIVDSVGVENRQMLVVKIKAAWVFGGKNLGRLDVPIKDILQGVTTEGKALETVNCRMMSKSGNYKGVVSFTYKIGEKFFGKPAQLQIKSSSSTSGWFVLGNIGSTSHTAHGHGGGGCGGGCGGGGC